LVGAPGLDQATGLRRMLGADNGPRALGIFGADAALNAHAGANLATAMAQRGASVTIIDEVPPPLNVATRLGIVPETSLAQYLAGQAPGKARAPGMRVLRAERLLRDAADLPPQVWRRLEAALPASEIDWLFLAAPADEGPCLALAAPRRVLVVPGARNRLTEAYALLKSLHQQQPDGRWWILFMELDDAARAQAMMAAITETSRRFLEVEPAFLGHVPRDGKLRLAERALRALLDFAPDSAAAAAFRAAAESLARQAPASDKLEYSGFWQRMGLIGRTLSPHAENNRLETARGGHYR
jgi:flagellar biosynthesis protein FlhG